MSNKLLTMYVTNLWRKACLTFVMTIVEMCRQYLEADLNMNGQPAGAASTWELGTGIRVGAEPTAFRRIVRGVLPT